MATQKTYNRSPNITNILLQHKKVNTMYVDK